MLFLVVWIIKQKSIENVLKGFRRLLENDILYQNKIQLILLGQINNKVQNWIHIYKLDKVVQTFDHYVGEEDMEKYMSRAHYAIISTYKNSIYGKYKISGAFWDAVWFDVPILLSHYYAPGYKNDNIIRFHNNALDKVLINIIKWKIK